MDRSRLQCAAALAAAFLAACGGAPPPAAKKAEPAVKAEPAGPPVPVAARSAFFEMYKPARTWASDILPLSLTAGEIPGIENEGGKAAQWTAIFVSPSRREARAFVYAVADHGTGIHKGLTVGDEEVWSGSTRNSQPFQTADFVTDSDAAYKTASQKAAAWLHSHPGKKVTAMALTNGGRFAGPVWTIMWGDRKNGYLAFVNATTGLAVK